MSKGKFLDSKEESKRELNIVLMLNRMTHEGRIEWRREEGGKFDLNLPRYRAELCLESGETAVAIIGPGGRPLGWPFRHDDRRIPIALGIFSPSGHLDELITSNVALRDLWYTVRYKNGDVYESRYFMDLLMRESGWERLDF